jgi:hypothetical protein
VLCTVGDIASIAAPGVTVFKSLLINNFQAQITENYTQNLQSFAKSASKNADFWFETCGRGCSGTPQAAGAHPYSPDFTTTFYAHAAEEYKRNTR